MLLVVGWLLIVAASALKRSNIGKNEWSVQNIGEVTSATLESTEFRFYSEKGIYGAVDSKSGQLKWKTELEPTYKFLGELIHNTEAEWEFAAAGLNHIIYQQEAIWQRLLKDSVLPN